MLSSRGSLTTPYSALSTRLLAVAAGSAAMAIGIGVARYAYGLLLPVTRAGLDADYAAMGLVASANFVAYLLLAPVSGAVASHFGARRVVAGALLVVGLGLALTGASRSVLEAAVAQVITGVGSAAIVAPVMGAIPPLVPPHWRGRASGISAGGIGVGMTLSGLAVPPAVVAVGTEGWRVGWWLCAASALPVALACALWLPGAVHRHTASASGGGVAAVYRDSVVWALGVLFLFFGMAYIIYATFFAGFAAEVLGLPPTLVGVLWSVAGALSALSGVLFGSLADRFGPRRAFALNFGLLAACGAILALGAGEVAAWLATISFGVAGWGVTTIMAVTVALRVPARLAPAAMGLVILLMGVGQATGPVAAGYFIEYAGGFTAAFGLMAFTAAIAVVYGLALPLRRPAAYGQQANA